MCYFFRKNHDTLTVRGGGAGGGGFNGWPGRKKTVFYDFPNRPTDRQRNLTLGTLFCKKNGKKRGHCPLVGGGVNPSSFFKAKFTGFSNHSEMDF